MRKLGYGLLVVALAIAAAATNAFAGVPAPRVPEINPGSISAGLALLTGGVLIARARFRK